MLGNNDFVSPIQKVTLSKFFVKGLHAYKHEPLSLDQNSIQDFALTSGLDQELITKVINPLSTGLFFLSPQEYSAYVFFGTIAPYVDRLHTLKIGAFAGGMTGVMIDPIAQAIQHKGGVISTNQTVQKILVNAGKVVGVETKQELIHTPQVVVATDIKNAQTLITNSFDETATFHQLLSLDTMPAITIQFDLPQPSHSSDRVVFSPGTLFASYAEQSRSTFDSSSGRISIILANPSAYIHAADETILSKVLADARRINLHLDDYRDYRIVRLPHDFYALKPGRQQLRPSQKTDVAGLTLAGDYTNQEFLATMEGAVVSGNLAAQAILGDSK